MTDNIRRIAADALLRWERDLAYINSELDKTLERSSLLGPDRALCAAIMYGVTERKLTLDYEIERIAERKISEIDAEAVSLLRVGLYQIYYMDRVPNHAAVNETVSAAPRKIRGFVNAVLRTAIRDGGEPKLPCRSENESRYLSLMYSVPEWLVSLWTRDYGAEAALKILEAVNSQPKVTLRVNTLKTSTEALLSKLKESGAEAEIHPYIPDMIVLGSGAKITELYGFDEGEWFVQDPASRMAALATDAKAGETVIDVCSAPGGKSFSLAIDMKNEGKIFSHDLHENKIRLIKKGAERLGISIINASARDGSSSDEADFCRFDRVLCDVPCSGLGVIAKKPDIRYKNEADIKRLPEVQYKILSASKELVRVGGTLVYSTCTVRRAENDDIRERFLAENPDFVPFLPEMPVLTHDGQITLFPHEHGTDGFYIAGFKRIK